MAFYLLIGVRLNNIVCLVTQLSTFCCLLHEKVEKNSNRPTGCSKTQHECEHLSSVSPWSRGGHTLSAVTVPLWWRSHCVLRIPKSALILSPGTAESWLEAEHSRPQLWLTWWMIQVTAYREAGVLAVKDRCVDYPLCHEKLTTHTPHTPPILSLFSCKLWEPSEQMQIKEVCKKTGFNA